MSSAGNGEDSLNGLGDSRDGAGSGGDKIPAGARRLDRRVVRPNHIPSRMNPEQGCYGCLISVGVVIATILVWVFIYWYNEPSFHPPDEDALQPPPAQTIRRRNQNQ